MTDTLLAIAAALWTLGLVLTAWGNPWGVLLMGGSGTAILAVALMYKG